MRCSELGTSKTHLFEKMLTDTSNACLVADVVTSFVTRKWMHRLEFSLPPTHSNEFEIDSLLPGVGFNGRPI